MSDLINVSAESQNGQILAWLEAGESITPLDALKQFDCLSLAQRIKNLRDYGWPIEKILEQKNGKRYARYFMNKGGNS